LDSVCPGSQTEQALLLLLLLLLPVELEADGAGAAVMGDVVVVVFGPMGDMEGAMVALFVGAVVFVAVVGLGVVLMVVVLV